MQKKCRVSYLRRGGRGSAHPPSFLWGGVPPTMIHVNGGRGGLFLKTVIAHTVCHSRSYWISLGGSSVVSTGFLVNPMRSLVEIRGEKCRFTRRKKVQELKREKECKKFRTGVSGASGGSHGSKPGGLRLA